jgi:hypothetical protein
MYSAYENKASFRTEDHTIEKVNALAKQLHQLLLRGKDLATQVKIAIEKSW